MDQTSQKCTQPVEADYKIFEFLIILLFSNFFIEFIIQNSHILNNSHSLFYLLFVIALVNADRLYYTKYVYLIFIIIQIVSEMKTSVNKFDYPTASSQAYKVYKQDKSKETGIQTQKLRYREFDKQQRDNQRMKVKQEKQRKQQIQRKQNKRKLQQQLEKKKQQLIELQKMKNMAIEAQKKSHQLAIIRQQQQRIMKMEQQRKAKQNQYNAQNRFLQALKRVQQQKDINNKKQKEAMHRRKTAEETQKIERGKAIKYRQEIEQIQKSMKPQQKRSFNDYKQPLGRTAYNKTVDYSKTCLHNPNIIIASLDGQQNALERADKFNSRQKQKSQERKAKQQQNRKISLQRGKKAMEKLALQKEYQEYLRQQQEKAKLYNIQRIEAGKKNQYVGLKPGTLVQMEANRRLRCQEQFQQMFFGGQNPQWFDKPTNRYNIVQNRLGDTIIQTSVESHNKKNQQMRSIGSVGAVVSDSHYSFESEGIDALTSVKKPEQQQLQIHQPKKRVIPLPKQLTQNSPERPNDHRDRQELRYSQSQDEQA